MDERLLHLRDIAAEETRAAAAARRVQEVRLAQETRLEEHQRKVKEITTVCVHHFNIPTSSYPSDKQHPPNSPPHPP